MTNPYGPPPGPQPMPPPQQGGYAPPGSPVPQPPMGPGPQGPGGPAPMGPGQAPIGQQMGPPPAGMGRLVIDAGFFRLAWVLTFLKPVIMINGRYHRPTRWGANVIDLPPGQYQVHAHVPYLWQFGHATQLVPVNAGQQVDLAYRAPAITFGFGALGPPPQRIPHAGLAIGVFAGAWAVIILVIIFVIVVIAAAT